jgi:hypothetical protein
VCGINNQGINVSGTLKEAVADKNPQVACVTTVSSLQEFESQAVELASAGLSVI